MSSQVGELSNKLVRRRKALGLSRSALARKVGMSSEAIRRIEVGLTVSPRTAALVDIARALDIEVEYFLTAETTVANSLKIGQVRASEFRVSLPFEVALNEQETHNLRRRLAVEFEIIRERLASDSPLINTQEQHDL